MVKIVVEGAKLWRRNEVSEFICGNCGYRKTVGNEFENMMETPVYPMYDASIVAPFLAMEYVQGGMGERCPGCGKFAEWKCID